MIVVNERNRGSLRVSFYNVAGALVAPATAEYRIDDQASGRQVRDWTSVTPASQIDIPLTSVDNAMVDPKRQSERRVVTIRADYNGAPTDEDMASAEYTYEVKNLRFLT